ncbi:hypothetical protein EIP91_005648 [Steccherinum ochraceum]|uniref:Uncharacterized protein n=1 Tax=Steccherinum ochraceum TaxID=92696 RepID=A0A4V2MVT9_9APHY|nr:hypothetical protein EIP91_005648 [Steccherinum ochraceum]
MNQYIPLDDDFFPDWGTDSVSRSTSLSERINLPSSVVLSSHPDLTTTNATYSLPSSHISSYLTNRTPCLLFFYGTLSLPHILQRVLSLDSAPILLPATIEGYSVKMWGPYPALIRPGQFQHLHNQQISPSSSNAAAVLSSVTAKMKSKLKRARSGSSSSVRAVSVSSSDGNPPDEVVVAAAEVSKEPIPGMAYWGTEEDIPELLRYEGENYEMVECVIRAGQDETMGRTFVWCGYPDELSEGSFDPTMFPDVENGVL